MLLGTVLVGGGTRVPNCCEVNKQGEIARQNVVAEALHLCRSGSKARALLGG